MSKRILRKQDLHRQIPIKANRILHLLLIFFAVLLVKSWHLSVVQHEERVQISERPKERELHQSAKRGTIRDRFNTPLAINKIQYNIAVLYSQIREIPRISWESGEKRYKRMEYIKDLSRLLAQTLDLDTDRVEDLIHSKSSLYFQVPYVIKEDVTEEQYYKLKILEKDWPGLISQKVPKRFYPKRKVGSDVIGYLGAISRSEYENLLQEKRLLAHFFDSMEVGDAKPLPEGFSSVEEAYLRFEELKERSYSIHDYVGKMGVEGEFEEDLRGYYGKMRYLSNARGSFIKELEGTKEPIPGKRLLLSISEELQEFAEKLLIQSESLRSPRVNGQESSLSLPEMRTWIKGGAIVALDPKNGDVLALASYPRVDLNDFILPGDKKRRKMQQEKISQWFETPHYLAGVYDQKRPLVREVFDFVSGEIVDESIDMTWDNYLDFILPTKSAVRLAIERVLTVERAILLQRRVGRLLSICQEDELLGVINSLYSSDPHVVYGPPLRAKTREKIADSVRVHARLIQEIKREIDPFFHGIPRNDDKVLLVDLCRLVVNADQFPDELLSKVGHQSLGEYRLACAKFSTISEAVKERCQKVFHDHFFTKWREECGESFLKEKRAEEKAKGVRYAKPYLDYFDEKEREMFFAFFAMEKWNLIFGFVSENEEMSSPLRPYLLELEKMREALDPTKEGEKSLLEAIWVLHFATKGLGKESAKKYLTSLRSFEDLTRPLLGKYRHLRGYHEGQIEQDLACAFYPLHGYGFGRSFAFRQATTQGSIFKVVLAYQALLQKYEALGSGLKTFATLNPLTLVDDYYQYNGKMYMGHDIQGRPIPEYYKGGRLIRSHRKNFGKVDLLKALELSSNPYFSILAGDVLNDPADLTKAAAAFSYGSKTGLSLPGEFPGHLPEDISIDKTALYATAIGQHTLMVTPVQAAVCIAAIANGGGVLSPNILKLKAGKGRLDKTEVELTETTVVNTLKMPAIVRHCLLEGMDRIVKREQRVTIGSLEKQYSKLPNYIRDFLQLKGQLVAKSGTAESVERVSLDSSLPSATFNHVWYGAISFEDDHRIGLKEGRGEPELVVIIYLKYGEWGKDAAPLAAQMVHKWREIKKKSEAS